MSIKKKPPEPRDDTFDYNLPVMGPKMRHILLQPKNAGLTSEEADWLRNELYLGTSVPPGSTLTLDYDDFMGRCATKGGTLGKDGEGSWDNWGAAVVRRYDACIVIVEVLGMSTTAIVEGMLAVKKPCFYLAAGADELVRIKRLRRRPLHSNGKTDFFQTADIEVTP